MSAAERAEKLAELESIQERAVAGEAAVTRIGELLEDKDEEVRAEAAGAAWQYPAASLVGTLERLAKEDPAAGVRLRSISALGRIVREGDLAGAGEDGYAPDPDLDEPPGETFSAVKGLLLAVLEDGGDDERRCAIESLAYLSGEERVVSGIEALTGKQDAVSRASALRAMGRSGDAPRWRGRILEEIEASEKDVVLSAIEAAGEAEVVEAAPLLARILRGSRQPQNQRIKAALSLGRLGGKTAAPTLLEVSEDEATDAAVLEAVREVLAELTEESGDDVTKGEA